MGLKLVIVSGNPVRTRLGLTLENQGHGVVEVLTVDTMPSAPDGVLVDLRADGVDGAGRVREVRRDHDVPILLLGTAADVGRIVAALEAGADDYVTEPFDAEEVTARLRALRRRARTAGDQDGVRDILLEADPDAPLVLSPNSETVRRGDRDLRLTATEYRLLHELVRAPGRILHRSRLLERVWRDGTRISGRTLNMHISHLRAKLEENPANPRLVVTVRGFGYRLDTRV